jgi:hypothetical protein
MNFKQQYGPVGAALNQGVAVDIDDTLAATNARWAEVLIKRFGSPEGLDSEGVIRKYKYVRNVPYWLASSYVDAFMENADELLALPAVSGAREALLRLNGIVSCYITTRSESMSRATTEWLRRHDFPSSHVLSMPVPARAERLHPLVWKAGLLEYLFPRVRGVIDDDAEMINALGQSYGGILYLLGGSPETSLPGVISCSGWEEVLEAIQKSSRVVSIRELP